MTKRDSKDLQSLKETELTGLAASSSPFALKIPRVDENHSRMDEVSPTASQPLNSRKRKRSVFERGEEILKENGDADIDNREQKEEKQICHNFVVDEFDELAKKYECVNPELIPQIGSREFQYFTVDPLDMKELAAIEFGCESGNDQYNRLDEDDSNDEDNWRNEYPDSDLGGDDEDDDVYDDEDD